MKYEIRYLAGGVEKTSSETENEDYSLIEEKEGARTTVTMRVKRPVTLLEASFKRRYTYLADDSIFLNGYQSWTDTREFGMNETLHNMNRLPKKLKDKYHFENYGDAWFIHYDKDSFHSFTYSYVRHADGTADLVGSLNENNAYMIISHRLDQSAMQFYSDCENRKVEDSFVLFDYAAYRGEARKIQEKYFAWYGPCEAEPIRGYTSWYLDYQDISEKKIFAALSGTDPADFDLFQIDDGYETFVGDWLDVDPAKFPGGLQWIVDSIHGKGMKAGIWLAPFVCEVKSRLYREHPDWIYTENGEEVFAGCNWSGDVVLDVRKREVQDYIRECLEYYVNLGFDFFKLDFLYAAALIREDCDLTRAEIMRKAMEGLREILGDRLILGCGVPLSSAFGLVDYCRIGPDVSLKFDDAAYMRLMHRERVSTKVTLQNTIFRSAMDGYVFRCDPDVFLLRDDHIKLSKKQRKALLLINHLCGSVYMTSDRAGEYDEEKKELMARARTLSGAKVTDVRRDGHRITVFYELDGKEDILVYDTEKGELIDG